MVAKRKPAKIVGKTDVMIESKVDGVHRAASHEKRINEAFALVFSDDTGAIKVVKDYLRQITIESIGGYHISNDELRHREGGRFIIGVIEARTKLGRGKK